MQANIAVVVIAYNRPVALKRLLSSLGKANYDNYSNVPLIISIDYSGNNDCIELANNFVWLYGNKRIISHSNKQGLKSHVLQCGDLCLTHDAIVVLEDDLFVSPAFYDYSQQAYVYYKEEEKVAGIGLYNYRFNEIAFCPFEPISDGFDNYFLQVPCSWGQMWTKEQWQLFKSFLLNRQNGCEEVSLPETVKLWDSETSWKKLFYEYMIFAERYFVYPRISLTTNFGDIGQHLDGEVSVWQTPFLLSKKHFIFSKLGVSNSIYDAFFELDASVFIKTAYPGMDICIDLNGSKPLEKVKNQYLVSSKKCTNPMEKYSLALYPYENNILLELYNDNLTQNYISLGKTVNFQNEFNVDRRLIDIKRVFFNSDLLTAIGRNSVYRTKDYKTGNIILKPLRFFGRLLNR